MGIWNDTVLFQFPVTWWNISSSNGGLIAWEQRFNLWVSILVSMVAHLTNRDSESDGNWRRYIPFPWIKVLEFPLRFQEWSAVALMNLSIDTIQIRVVSICSWFLSLSFQWLHDSIGDDTSLFKKSTSPESKMCHSWGVGICSHQIWSLDPLWMGVVIGHDTVLSKKAPAHKRLREQSAKR